MNFICSQQYDKLKMYKTIEKKSTHSVFLVAEIKMHFTFEIVKNFASCATLYFIRNYLCDIEHSVFI